MLAVLGDSTSVGQCDPALGGGWRGFAVLLRAALGDGDLVNAARAGARVGDVRHRQLPAAVAARPDVAVIAAGMNDTLRSDFDPAALLVDLSATVTALRAVGAHVLLLRYHDHTRLVRLPALLGRALRRRIVAVNAVIDALAAADPVGVAVLDLDRLAGGYEPAAWAVDRLHPSERGHRLLADGLAGLLVEAGFAVAEQVSLECSGGRRITTAHRAAWLLLKGVPWLARRTRDLTPTIVQAVVSERREVRRRGPVSGRPARSARPRPARLRSARAEPGYRSGTAR